MRKHALAPDRRTSHSRIVRSADADASTYSWLGAHSTAQMAARCQSARRAKVLEN